MAYLSYLASVPENQVLAIRTDANVTLHPSMLIPVSHLIANWVGVQPLGELLGKAIDGGETLNEKLTHPFRSPTYHDPQGVRLLNLELTKAWREATRDESSDVGSDMWYRMEMGKTLRAVKHAAECGECLVSANQPKSYIFSAVRSE
jgi:hypothetical protein